MPKPTRVIGSLDVAAAARAAYNFSEIWAAAFKHYAVYGRLSHVEPISREFQTAFAVIDYKNEPLSAEFGIGHGFTAGSDALIVKLILSQPPSRARRQSKTITPRATSPASINLNPSLISSNR